MSLNIKKQCKCRKLFFVYPQVGNVQHIEMSYGVSTKEIRVERGRFVVLLDERASVLNHEEDVRRWRYVEARVIEVCGAKSFRC